MPKSDNLTEKPRKNDYFKVIGNLNVQQEELKKAVRMTCHWPYFINCGQRESKSKFAQVNSKPT
jgi:endonuclease IV